MLLEYPIKLMIAKYCVPKIKLIIINGNIDLILRQVEKEEKAEKVAKPSAANRRNPVNLSHQEQDFRYHYDSNPLVPSWKNP